MPVTIVWEWDGEGLKPLPQYAREADRRFVIGERYLMDEFEERSWQSHKHYFACIKKAFENLPELLPENMRAVGNPDDLRKHALIMTGWHVAKQIPMPTEALAQSVMKGMSRGFKDEYSILTITPPDEPGGAWIVTQFWARTQTNRGPLRMDHKTFQKSKDDVLNWLADLIGVPLEELTRNEKAAQNGNPRANAASHGGSSEAGGTRRWA